VKPNFWLGTLFLKIQTPREVQRHASGDHYRGKVRCCEEMSGESFLNTRDRYSRPSQLLPVPA
jgi:hypothetical protein